MIYGYQVNVATRALRFGNHMTKENGGSGDENVVCFVQVSLFVLFRNYLHEVNSKFHVIGAKCYASLFFISHPRSCKNQ